MNLEIDISSESVCIRSYSRLGVEVGRSSLGNEHKSWVNAIEIQKVGKMS